MALASGAAVSMSVPDIAERVASATQIKSEQVATFLQTSLANDKTESVEWDMPYGAPSSWLMQQIHFIQAFVCIMHIYLTTFTLVLLGLLTMAYRVVMVAVLLQTAITSSVSPKGNQSRDCEPSSPFLNCSRYKETCSSGIRYLATPGPKARPRLWIFWSSLASKIVGHL